MILSAGGLPCPAAPGDPQGLHGIIEAGTESVRLNKIAAIWTAVAVFLGPLRHFCRNRSAADAPYRLASHPSLLEIKRQLCETPFYEGQL